MSKKLDPSIIRIGDRVKIIKPFIFLRCGYPLSKQDIKDSIPKEKLDLLENFVASFTGLNQDIFNPNYKLEKIVEKVKDQLAYGILIAKGFGGNKRSIFSKEVPSILNLTGTVRRRKIVKSGIREHGSADPETGCYDPPWLGNIKSHVIFEIDLNIYLEELNSNPAIWVEKTNLEKIHAN